MHRVVFENKSDNVFTHDSNSILPTRRAWKPLIVIVAAHPSFYQIDA